MYFVRLFFFSSRRRHTRWPRDWSSDVCSSELALERGRQTALIAVPRSFLFEHIVPQHQRLFIAAQRILNLVLPEISHANMIKRTGQRALARTDTGFSFKSSRRMATAFK